MTQPEAAIPSTPAARIELDVRVHESWSEVEAFEAEWDSLGTRIGGDIYTSPVYAKIWWKHYGRGTPAIIEVRGPAGSNGQRPLLAVVPLYVERNAGALGSRVGRIMSADSTIAVLTPHVEPAHAARIWQAVLERMLVRCDILCLGCLEGRRPVADAIELAAREAGAIFRRRQLGVHTTFLLPATFDAYLQGLEKRQRSNLRRDLNQFAKQSEASVSTIVEATDVPTAFDEFLALHAAQWDAQGKSGHFGDWPGSAAYSKELNESLSRDGRVQIVRLACNGHVVDYEWSFLYGRRGFWRLPARLVDPESEKLGMGRVGMARMLEAMIQSGASEVEAGPGHYDYKVKHGAVETPLFSVWIHSPAALSRLRASAFAAFAYLVDRAYYRLWFLRLRPRLKAPRRPLARLWSKLRI